MTLSCAEAERLVLDAAEEVLGISGLSPRDNFFALGGTSMAAINLIMLLSERLSRDVALDIIFERPTFGQMAQEIARTMTGLPR